VRKLYLGSEVFKGKRSVSGFCKAKGHLCRSVWRPSSGDFSKELEVKQQTSKKNGIDEVIYRELG